MDVKDRLNRFIEAHPSGWDHQAWLGLLDELRSEGVDISEPESLGLELERERVTRVLSEQEVRGLGPKRVEALAERYPTLWSLRQASPDELAQIKTIPGTLAKKIHAALHGDN